MLEARERREVWCPNVGQIGARSIPFNETEAPERIASESFSPTSAVQKVVLLILNELRCFLAVFLHYILHRF